MTDLMAGHVDLLFASVLEASGNIKAGKLKGLAVTHAKRIPALPDVPTIAEAGVQGRRVGLVDRAARAGGHARGDHREARRGREGGGGGSGGAREAGRAGRGAAVEHAGASCRR